MKNLKKSFFIALVTLLFSANSYALIVAVEIGADGTFSWELGKNDQIVFDVGDGTSSWTVNVEHDSYIDVFIKDYFSSGDVFDLYLNNNYLEPSMSNFDGTDTRGGSTFTNLYQAWYEDIFLVAGSSNIFELQLGELSATPGTGGYSFSAVSRAVPEPVTFTLLLTGLLLLYSSQRRSSKGFFQCNSY